VLYLFAAIYTAYKVPTGSMQPNLKPGDFIFCSRIAYGISFPFLSDPSEKILPERGDVVVFHYAAQPGVTYVKRVIGLPGDRIQILKGRLILNDIPLDYEPLNKTSDDNPNPDLFDIYAEKTNQIEWRVILQKLIASQDFGPMIVPPGEIFLLGDNRDASDDSRYWGTVPAQQIVGKVGLIWLSLDSQRKWGGNRYPSVRWDRVFSWVR
jgi:signal peptidase I